MTEMDALVERVRDVRLNAAHPNRNSVAYDCLRMFEDMAERVNTLAAERSAAGKLLVQADKYMKKLTAERDEARTLLTAALARVTKLEAEKRNLEQFAHMVKGLPACQEYARAYGITGEAL